MISLYLVNIIVNIIYQGWPKIHLPFQWIWHFVWQHKMEQKRKLLQTTFPFLFVVHRNTPLSTLQCLFYPPNFPNDSHQCTMEVGWAKKITSPPAFALQCTELSNSNCSAKPDTFVSKRATSTGQPFLILKSNVKKYPTKTIFSSQMFLG